MSQSDSLRLKESDEASRGMIEQSAPLISFKEILPVLTILLVHFDFCAFTQASSHSRDTKVVVAVFKRSGDRSCHGSEPPEKVLGMISKNLR